MPDEIFEHPRLVEIYDAFDGARNDLDHYYKIAEEFEATSLLDIGSGTGCFSCLLAENEFEVTGLEPAKTSLDKAKSKKYADRVHWILGDAKVLPDMQVDMAFMTGNVAQVFLEDQEWEENLKAIKKALKSGGYFVFEVRDPAQQAWKNWTRENTHTERDIPGIGIVEGWCDLESVSGQYVSFVWSYKFHANDEVIQSKSTLRFREKVDIAKSLENVGFEILDIREAPDRPKQEFVFIARKP